MLSRLRAFSPHLTLALVVWVSFHLWQQWAVFGGRDAWLARMTSTSNVIVETLVVVLVIGWSIDALRGGPSETPFAKLGRAAGAVAAVLVLGHIAHLWLPELVFGARPEEAWQVLAYRTGTPWMLGLYAIGLTAFAIHLAAALPRALDSVFAIEQESSRRQARLVCAVFALFFWVLSVQLVG